VAFSQDPYAGDTPSALWQSPIAERRCRRD